MQYKFAKIHFKIFLPIFCNALETFCVTLCIKHAIIHLKKNKLISLHLVQYKFAKIRLKNPPPPGRNALENFCVNLSMKNI